MERLSADGHQVIVLEAAVLVEVARVTASLLSAALGPSSASLY